MKVDPAFQPAGAINGTYSSPWSMADEIRRLTVELAASNDTIDMLYERSKRFAAQADRYEKERDAAQEEITRLRRLLGEIP